MIWGVDTATRITGITAGTGEVTPAVGHWDFDYCGNDIGRLLSDFDDRLRELAGRMPPTLIMFESPILRPHDRTEVVRKLFSMAAYLELFGRRHGARVEEASAKRLKKALTGDATAEKAAMVAMCRKLKIRLPAGPAAQDAADSFAAWYIGIQNHAPQYAAAWDQAILSRRGGLL